MYFVQYILLILQKLVIILVIVLNILPYYMFLVVKRPARLSRLPQGKVFQSFDHHIYENCFGCSMTLCEPSTNRESTPRDHVVSTQGPTRGRIL